MIKIFGKVRYHWQPEMSVLVIYWSLSVIPIFIGLALMYESSSVPKLQKRLSPVILQGRVVAGPSVCGSGQKNILSTP